MIKCIAVDDEPLALALLKDNISRIPFLELVAECTDAFEAAKAMDKHTVDLIFIDIQMPGLSGLQFIGAMQQKPMVILITAYEQYALESYDLNVVDYLLKPVELARFMAACNKAKELYALKKTTTNALNKEQDYFFINVDYSLLKVMFNDIIYAEGLRDYVKIHRSTAPSRPIVARLSIKALEEQLPSRQFIRIHKSYIVSIAQITSIRKSTILIDSLELPVGETYRDAVKALTNV